MAIYELAYHLGKDVEDILEMPYDRFIGWMTYFEKRPVDWRGDLQAALIMQAQGVKDPPWKIFDSLRSIFNKKNPLTDTLRGSKVFHLLGLAKGGEKLNLWKEEDLE